VKSESLVPERPVPVVSGTRAFAAAEFDRHRALIDSMLSTVDHAGYDLIETPVLDLVELHERKSGAAVTTRIVDLCEIGDQGAICLRPELTVGVVRSVVETGSLASGPVRLGVVGTVFRRDESEVGGLRGIEQIGAELIGDSSVEADAEVIALAIEALDAAGVGRTVIRLGDVGLILDAVAEAGLPREARKAIVETLADSAAAGKGIAQVESDLEHWGDWLDEYASAGSSSVSSSTEEELRRLYHHLIGPVVGRRTETEILSRLRKKWALADSLPSALKKAANVVHELGTLAGPADRVLASLRKLPIGPTAEAARSRMQRLVELLASRAGIDSSRIRIDFGVARGIGFYSGLVFGIHAGDENGVELAGGGRYDGLATVLGMSEGRDAGVGFAIGLDRVSACLESQNSELPKTESTFVITPLEGDSGSLEHSASLVRRIRKAGGRARLSTPADVDPLPGCVTVDVDSQGRLRSSDPIALSRMQALANKDS
jgi:histidyl-tRNA synthetase